MNPQNPNRTLIGCWVLYDALYQDLNTKVHPDDREKVRSNFSVDPLFVVDVEDDYLRLKFGKEVCRVLAKDFSVVEGPTCSVDDRIVIRRTNGKWNEVRIHWVMWHDKRQMYYYLVEYQGKSLSRWVFDEDIFLKLSA